jgi:hypothetical protein
MISLKCLTRIKLSLYSIKFIALLTIFVSNTTFCLLHPIDNALHKADKAAHHLVSNIDKRAQRLANEAIDHLGNGANAFADHSAKQCKNVGEVLLSNADHKAHTLVNDIDKKIDKLTSQVILQLGAQADKSIDKSAVRYTQLGQLLLADAHDKVDGLLDKTTSQAHQKMEELLHLMECKLDKQLKKAALLTGGVFIVSVNAWYMSKLFWKAIEKQLALENR